MVGWNSDFLNKDGHFVGCYGVIVHNCPIVVYFTKSADVIVFRKNGLWPFSGFCAQKGIRKFSGNRSEVLFCFFVFYEVILALENSPEKNNGKNSKSPEINSKLLFSGKKAPENKYEIEWFW